MKVSGQKSRWFSLSRCATAAAALLFSAALPAVGAPASPPAFDWSSTSNSNYTPSPILTDQNVASVAAQLHSMQQANPNATLAVKITTPISNATADAIFGNFKIAYVFADFENSDPISSVQNLDSQLKRPGSQSTGAFLGQFNLYNTQNDSTRPGTASSGAASFAQTFNQSNYLASGANVSMPAAYPGSPDFKTPGQSGDNGISTPNIRSALFVLPIDRVTYATDFSKFGSYPSATPTNAANGGYQNIPWVTRFDNWGNSALNNAPGYDGYKYAFNTTGTNNPYANQLPSRGDFEAQMLHYRLRGATGFSDFSYTGSAGGVTNTTYSSVIGYTAAQEQSDAYNGFHGGFNSTLDAIWGRGSYNFANLVNTVPTSPGKVSSASATGMVLSGIYDNKGSTRQLALLLSNMSDATQKVDLWQKYGGASVDLNGATTALDQYFTIAPGSHQLLQFNLMGTRWVLFADDNIFADSNRNGIGVPEPASVSLLGIAGAAMLLRRRARR